MTPCFSSLSATYAPPFGLLRASYSARVSVKLMKRFWGRTNLRNGILALLAAAVLAGQVYFVRELLAAELFLGLGFVVLLVFVGLVYLVGSVCMRGLEFAAVGLGGTGARRAAVSATSEQFVGKRPTIKGVHAPSV